MAATGALEKVAKAEPASRGTVQFSEDTILMGGLEQRDTSYLSKSLLSDLTSGPITEDESGLVTAPTTANTLAQRYTDGGTFTRENSERAVALPRDWPNIPQLFRRKSCELTKSSSTCVNKATSHLELLQSLIEEWYKEAERELLSQASSGDHDQRPSIVGILPGSRSIPGSKRQIRFASVTPTSPSHASSAGTRASTAQLSVQGVGGKADEVETAQPELLELPYLGAEEVVEEVITLLARLDRDRADTEQAFQKERDRVTSLSDRIDKLTLQKLRDMPAAVQNEHEACALDINELQWHVSYRGRIESRLQNKVDIAEVLYTRLTDDIAFVKKHCPLVQEKLELELRAMEKIRKSQADANEELNGTMGKCAKVEAKSGEAHAKADAERAHIKNDLDSVRDQLKKISDELAEAKMTYNTYVHLTSDYRQQLQDNEQELQVQQVKNENAKAAENMQATKVQDLEKRIVEAEFEHKKLKEENFVLSTRLTKHLNESDTAEKEFYMTITHKEEKLKRVVRKNQDRQLDIDDYMKKINDCERQQIADKKNLERMAKELKRTEQLTGVTQTDLQNVMTINNAIRDKLNAEEERCIQSEEGLKGTAEALKRQVREEIHARTVLMARINSDSGELVKTQEETKQKHEKVAKKADEVGSAVAVVERKVEKLRSAHAERTKAITGMQERIAQLEKEMEELQRLLATRKGELLPKHAQTKEKLTDVEKKLDYMEHRTELMQKKMEDMAASTRMMTRVVDSTQKAIDTFTEQLEELTIQYESGMRIGDDLKFSLDQVSSRLEDMTKRHHDHMSERKKVHEIHQQELKQRMKENKELAARYRRLQNQLVELKNQYMNSFDNCVKVEAAIKDLKQLQNLQQRMRAAMLEYYKYRGLYNKSELSRMEQESNQNGTKVAELQENMDYALEKISSFLKNQMDGSVARKIAMQKVNKEEKLAKQRSGVSVPTKTVPNSAVPTKSRSAIAAQS